MHNANKDAANPFAASCKDYKKHAHDQVGEWDQKIASLKEKGKDLVGDAKSGFDATLASLEESRNAFMEYVDDLEDDIEDKWDDLKDDAKDKWDKLASSVDNFFSKYT